MMLESNDYSVFSYKMLEDIKML